MQPTATLVAPSCPCGLRERAAAHVLELAGRSPELPLQVVDDGARRGRDARARPVDGAHPGGVQLGVVVRRNDASRHDECLALLRADAVKAARVRGLERRERAVGETYSDVL